VSLQLRSSYAVPEETARVARAAFPKGNVYMQMHEELGALYTDEMFAGLFPTRGQPAESPARLALVLVMQFAENLTDRQAADAVRSRIDWKYALGLDLTDPGFDYSILSEFRQRLLSKGDEQQLFEAMLTRFKEKGLLKGRGQQRTDSTHILAAVRSLNRLELVGRTLQQALNTVAQHAPEWIQTHIPPDWFDRYRRQLDDYRLPKGATERQTLATTIGNDGIYLLEKVEQEDAVAELRSHAALEMLRQVWEQQYEIEKGQARWREMKELLPSAKRIASPHDGEARYSTKRSVTWVGYKAHLSETCDEHYPNLITHVETTLSTTDDIKALPTIHQELAKRDHLPSSHLVDTAYGSAETLVESQTQYGIKLVCPVPPDNSWQAHEVGALDLGQFTIDWEAQRVMCPQGKASEHWSAGMGPRGRPTIQVQFRQADCRMCSARPHCTRSKLGARELTLHPRVAHEALLQARQRQQTAAFKAVYAQRAGVEGTMSQAAAARGMRRSRYIGLAKTHLQHLLTAAAINLTRVVAWWWEKPRAKTRRAPFAALAPA
jgi:transposase